MRHFFKILASEKPWLERMVKRDEPTMMQTMKQEKTIPKGVVPVSRTGVHRNTKIYMQDSVRDYKRKEKSKNENVTGLNLNHP